MRDSTSKLRTPPPMASRSPSPLKRRPRWIVISGAAIALAIGVYAARRGRSDVESTSIAPLAPARAPWVYGSPGARFTIIGYADLECPYCRDYFPILQQWVGKNDGVNWQWHHFPLLGDDPVTMQAARLAECAGEIGGNASFWRAVAWLYQHDSRDVSTLIQDVDLSEKRAAVEACTTSARLDTYIREQSIAASRDGVYATPTLRIVDHETGRDLLLPGPAEGDVLLSAIDFLLAPEYEQASLADEWSESSADASGASSSPR